MGGKDADEMRQRLAEFKQRQQQQQQKPVNKAPHKSIVVSNKKTESSNGFGAQSHINKRSLPLASQMPIVEIESVSSAPKSKSNDLNPAKRSKSMEENSVDTANSLKETPPEAANLLQKRMTLLAQRCMDPHFNPEIAASFEYLSEISVESIAIRNERGEELSAKIEVFVRRILSKSHALQTYESMICLNKTIPTDRTSNINF